MTSDPNDNDGLASSNVQIIMTAGETGAQDIFGSTQNDVLYGGQGNDKMYGGAGDDLIYGYSGNTPPLSTEGNPNGSDGDLIYGGSGNDRLYGNQSNDTLYGGSEDDQLRGNAGSDILYGGTGADAFIFDTPGDAIDDIRDFSTSDDTIWFDNLGFTSLLDGNLAADQFRIGTAAADANDFIVYNSITGQLFYDADGSGSGQQVLIATLTPGLSLTPNDFSVI